MTHKARPPRNLDTTESVMKFIDAYVAEHTYPPSTQEIGDAVHLARTSVQRHLDRLEGAGRIRRIPGMARGITILKPNDA